MGVMDLAVHSIKQLLPIPYLHNPVCSFLSSASFLPHLKIHTILLNYTCTLGKPYVLFHFLYIMYLEGAAIIPFPCPFVLIHIQFAYVESCA